MIDDVLIKLVRKLLRTGLYRALTRLLGRASQWSDPAMARSIRDYYLKQGLDFRDKRVVEVGGGGHFGMGMLLLEAGARQVILVDPKLAGGLARRTAAGRIECFRDLSEVPAALDGRIDVICSHLALEHFRDLESLFRHTARLMAEDGISHHRVDLSDHTYHFFTRYPFLAGFFKGRGLYHLRYSERAFRWLNDPKCYMNRMLLPDYTDMAGRHGLKLEIRGMRLYSPVRINEEILERYQWHPVAHLRVLEFGADVSKPRL
jgi:hypothetical protein